jgi:hypothetical protein
LKGGFPVSHIVQIETQLRDAEAIAAACRRLNLAPPVQGTFALYTAQASGLAVVLPGWQYPLVCATATGQVQYDNFAGHWGAIQELHRFFQAYAVEKARLEARKRGHCVTEQTLADGSIKLSIQLAGGAA